MGGFGAVKIALTHPGLYEFVGAMSPPLDAPRRPFSMRRVQQSWAFHSLFGPSAARREIAAIRSLSHGLRSPQRRLICSCPAEIRRVSCP